MVIKFSVPLNNNTDVVELELLDPTQIDLLCQKCQGRNDLGSFYCAWCGEHLSLKSKFTTQPLPPDTSSIHEEEADTASLDLSNTKGASVRNSIYEDSDSPNEAYQRMLDDRCGDAMRQLVNLQNRLHYSYITSPTKEGSKTNSNRVRDLKAVRDLLAEYDETIETLIFQEAKAKNSKE